NGAAPATSIANGIQLYAADDAGDTDGDGNTNSELWVRDEAGNATVLSPHDFELIPGGKSEELAWAFYSKREGKSINVDMAKLARTVEKLSAENLVYIKDEATGEVKIANLENELTKEQLVAKIKALEQRNIIQEKRLQQLEQQIQTLIND
ncbi:hypothetical protein N9R81_06385, partial [Flavobacteriales bacterium]|nr:hypothetical protein [Flavobacteriales bacterium]